MFNADKALMEKWAPVLDHESAPIIESYEKKAITARLLENTETALREEAAQQSYDISEAVGTGAGDSANMRNPDPVLISLVRRAMPNLVAYDVCGVQPMSGPTGLIFAMKARYGAAAGASLADVTTSQDEAFGPGPNSIDTDFSGDASTYVASVQDSGVDGTVTAVSGQLYQVLVAGDYSAKHAGNAASVVGDRFTANANGAFGGNLRAIDLGKANSYGPGEAVGTAEGQTPANMGFTIEKVTVTAKTRALKAEYTMELAQDLKAVHGLDAEAELANILSAEILAEINREVIGTIVNTAKQGTNGASLGTLDLTPAANGADIGGARWSAERYKALDFRLQQEANGIATDTRRGKGNVLICSASVASALSSAGSLDSAGAGLNVDNVGNTFAGTLGNGIKVYVDPYAVFNYAVVGYKGSVSYDAGLFYCPYVPLTMMKTIGESTFQPKVGFKTRYGMQANPFAAIADGVGNNNTNPFYRFSAVVGI